MVNINFKLPIEKGFLIEGALMNYMFTRDVVTSEANRPLRCVLDFGGVTLHLELITRLNVNAHYMDPNPYGENHHKETHIKMSIKHYDFLPDISMEDGDYNNYEEEESDKVIEDSVLGKIKSTYDVEEVEVAILRLMHRLKTRTIPRHVMLFNDGSTGCQTIDGD